jgi:hypothetical protein
MRSLKRFLFIPVIVVLFFSTSVSYGQQYSVALQQHTISGQLPAAQYEALRSLLQGYSILPLKDTLIIKYEYDMQQTGIPVVENDDIIQQNITTELRMLHNAMLKRKNITLLSMIEPGNRADSMKIYNNMVNVDLAKSVYRLLLNDLNAVNSVIILPSGKYICFNSADGWAALRVSGGEIQQLLSSTAKSINNH